MSVPSTLKYSHHTLVFYPLKNPLLRSAALVGEQGNELESSRYLRQRPGGFIFIRWLLNKFNEGEHDSNDTIVGLFASVDNPQELVVIKKLTALIQADLAADDENPMAPEIEHCTLSTAHPFVQRQLPLYHQNMELTPFPRTHAFQVHARGENINDPETLGRYENTDITLFIKYYNGGTLYELTMAHMRKQKSVPESFIWQFLSQMGRALSWMHTGVIPSREYNLQHQKDIEVAGKDVNKSKWDPQWRPICHTDAHASNIWLHYPTGDEKKADPRLKQFNDSLPQIILGDFGHSFQAHNDRLDYLSALVGPNDDVPEHWTMPDKCTLANNLFRLLLCALPRDFQAVHLGEKTDFNLSPWLRGIYSEDLVKCWDKLRPLVVVTKGGGGGAMDIQGTGYGSWDVLPLNDFVYGTMIAMADSYLHCYVAAEQDSVRWAQQVEAFMPYHAMTRKPKQHRADWKAVDGELEDVRTEQFKWYNPKCVKIRQAHIVGAGECVMEGEEINPWGPINPWARRDPVVAPETPGEPHPTADSTPPLPRRTPTPAGSQKTPTPPPQPVPSSAKGRGSLTANTTPELPDYEYYEEQEAADAAAAAAAAEAAKDHAQAGRATVLQRQPTDSRRTGIESPPIPDEYREWRKRQDELYTRKAREMRLAQGGRRRDKAEVAQVEASRINTLDRERPSDSCRAGIESPPIPEEYREWRKRMDEAYQRSVRVKGLSTGQKDK